MGYLQREKQHQAESDPSDSPERAAGYGNTYDPGLEQYTGSGTGAPSTTFSKAQERRLLRKIDFRLIPVLSVLYLLAFIDRTNIANAAVYGFTTDLGTPKGSNDYNTALTLFFVFYVLFEIPSNVILKKLKPHVWLPTCMMTFGILTVCQGLVSSIGGLYAVRLFLGLAEAGMFPGCFYLIGMWYKRSEAQKRFSFFFSSTSLAGAFSGLLAAALSHMDGLGGYRAWRWIFIIEGLLTCVCAAGFFFIVPDFPESAKFLSAAEKEFVKSRIAEDQGKSAIERKIRFSDVVNVFKDYKVVVGGFMYFGLIVPAYSYAFFAPLIIQGFHYSPVQTQLYSVPPWAAAFGFAMFMAFLSDLAKHRFVFILISITASICGFAIQLAPHLSDSIKYGGLFLVAAGTYTAMPLIVCWFNMNLGGHHRRAVGSAWQVGFGNIGGIIATYAFLPKDQAGGYVPGHAICIAFICLSTISCCIYFVGCYNANRQRNSLTNVGETEYEKQELGDLSSEYRYML